MSATGASAQRLRYSRTEIRDPDGVKTGYTGSRGFHVQLYYQARCTIHSALFHRSLVEEGARFDPAFLLMEDRDFFVNCASRTAFGFVDATTCIWHAHIGESGMGHGVSADPAIRERYLPMLHAKWEHLFDEWRSQLQGLLFYGQHLIRENKPGEALQYLEQAVRVAPRDINALNLCGMANLHAGNPARAEQLMRQAVALLPGNAHLRENLELIREVAAAPDVGRSRG